VSTSTHAALQVLYGGVTRSEQDAFSFPSQYFISRPYHSSETFEIPAERCNFYLSFFFFFIGYFYTTVFSKQDYGVEIEDMQGAL